ncbi:right-handed parallel beta-helix repeat-containing protein [Cohnella rhizosphaerae]|uniref:Right-handed parallel beta-helix repeat-containing protein n=1 Tax=Cohnella rhizosphaerae TaxID=1457232 RepID=A0A9X4QTM5_9BACL|nr:right-handed parallel beta-helix repeat-containing protein [Cohnella rhizosphaerae]MDG0809607.1 right-handed parallel beta-helix repeat-containing protein [Cohnella rhizosphaerae]
MLIEGNAVKDTQMAGIYIAVEANYNTVNVDRIAVKNNTIEHAGIHEPENHPNVLIYASQGVIDNVTFSGNTIKNAAHRGIGVWGDGQIKDIYFTGNTLINTAGANTTFKAGTIHLNDNKGF